jgi:hypothetical protein
MGNSVRLLFDDALNQLSEVEGRYIEWIWDPQTLKSDSVIMREMSGQRVIVSDLQGRESYAELALQTLEDMIFKECIREDESRKARGFRLYRPTEKGREGAATE